jgi:hypothetical protein
MLLFCLESVKAGARGSGNLLLALLALLLVSLLHTSLYEPFTPSICMKPGHMIAWWQQTTFACSAGTPA